MTEFDGTATNAKTGDAGITHAQTPNALPDSSLTESIEMSGGSSQRWLEIGSGSNPQEGYVHLDANPDAPHVEIVGDVRAIFIPQDYSIESYPELKYLKPGTSEDHLLLYDHIRLYHFVEHIHWFNQPAMWKWLWQILDYSGTLEITTPDLEYVIKTYYRNKSRWWRFWDWVPWFGRRWKYPLGEHASIDQNNDEHLSRWTCYKLYSGGSLDKRVGIPDYHLGLYDRARIMAELQSQGFNVSCRRTGGVLRVTARKASLREIDYYKMQIKTE